MMKADEDWVGMKVISNKCHERGGLAVDRVIAVVFSNLSNVSIRASPGHLPISLEAAARSAPRLCHHAQRGTGKSVKKTNKGDTSEDHTYNYDVLVSGQGRGQSDALPDCVSRLEGRNNTF